MKKSENKEITLSVHEKQPPLKYQIWTNHYDLSELPIKKYGDFFKQRIHITTKKITFLAMLLVLNLVCEVFSRFVLGLAPIGGFLTFNIVFWTYIISFFGVGLFYTIIFIEISSWFRMLLGTNFAACLAINLTDLTMLIFFAIVLFLINFLRVRIFKIVIPKQRLWWLLLTTIIAFIIAIFATAGMCIIYNKFFLIKLYYAGVAPPTDIKPLLIIIFWFNLCQGFINMAFVIVVFRINYVLINRYFYDGE